MSRSQSEFSSLVRLLDDETPEIRAAVAKLPETVLDRVRPISQQLPDHGDRLGCFRRITPGDIALSRRITHVQAAIRFHHEYRTGLCLTDNLT